MTGLSVGVIPLSNNRERREGRKRGKEEESEEGGRREEGEGTGEGANLQSKLQLIQSRLYRLIVSIYFSNCQ